MEIKTIRHALSWFETNHFKLPGYLRQGGDRFAVNLAVFGSKHPDATKQVQQIGEVLENLRRLRGPDFIKAHVFPLVQRASRFSPEAGHSAAFLLTELRQLQTKPTAIGVSTGISDIPEEHLRSAADRFTKLVNLQQFFDPEAYGTHYHKDPAHSLKKEEIVGKAAADLHGNVLLGKKGAVAIIGAPRVGKGRLSFLLSHFHGFPIVADDRVHILFSPKAANVVGPYKKYGFRAASQYYAQGRKFYEGVFGSIHSPDFPAEIKNVFWEHGRNPDQLFKGKSVPSTAKAPLHPNLHPMPLKTVFLLETHESPETLIERVDPSYVVDHLANRTDVGVPTVFGYPATYPVETKLSQSQRLSLSKAVVTKLHQKGVSFYRIKVPLDPKEFKRSAPSRNVKKGTTFDNRMAAAEHIARLME